MTTVTAHMSISLDGFYAGPKWDGEGSWMESPEALNFFRITRWAIDAAAWRERQGYKGGEDSTNSDIIQEYFETTGAYVMGRRMFEGGEVPWGDTPPFRAPVFVVTHRPKETLVKNGGTSFTFVTDGIASAIEQARAEAGGKDVAIAGGGVLLGQAIAAGLVEQLELNIAPVLLGEGMRLLDPAALDLADDVGVELTPTRVIDTPDVTHIRYRIEGPTELTLDDRGRGDGALDK